MVFHARVTVSEKHRRLCYGPAARRARAQDFPILHFQLFRLVYIDEIPLAGEHLVRLVKASYPELRAVVVVIPLRLFTAVSLCRLLSQLRAQFLDALIGDEYTAGDGDLKLARENGLCFRRLAQ